MGFKYSITTNEKYFLTITVVDWVDVFTRKELAAVIVDALNYCIEHKGLQVYAWCLMPSHLHLIASTNNDEILLSDVMRDFKKFTSKEVVKTIQLIPESRREWLLNKFEFAGRYNPKIKNYKFWQDGLHPIEVTSNKFTDQKLNYIHQNPVEAGIVYSAKDYILSSAAVYAGEYPGLVKVTILE
ncbi:REP element-mobilizing transposase RayT [Mucilaginibacter gracilis]|uniref:REP element-mobilizing transposase RayT n=1 Tax=Mucilaginibacter gracilis TaxID=423350 RepID=A0A495JAE8_9SPHI|nr:transposase [Mucilaginibacter gracilis]RKR85448.1 REP element-mobilizing transposase RayT [Mucilaginibacter gracilis]